MRLRLIGVFAAIAIAMGFTATSAKGPPENAITLTCESEDQTVEIVAHENARQGLERAVDALGDHAPFNVDCDFD